MYINKKSPIPAYYQLKNIILRKIKDGEFPVGSPIPSERDLSQTLNISRMTVRQALNQLVFEGKLYREKGKGTFVSKAKIEQRNIMSFSDIARERGFIPSTRVLDFDLEPATEEIAAVLDLNPSERVYHLKRLRLANEIPVGIEEVYLPEKYCPQLEKFDLTTSFYRLLREEYLHVISYVDNEIEVSIPAKYEKELLKITNNVAVMKITGINYSEEIKLFFESSIYRSDEYKFSVRVYVDKDLE
jgi:GntR family transcriptional regulator